MTSSTPEIKCYLFFYFDLVGGETMSFGGKNERQGITPLYPNLQCNMLSTNEVDILLPVQYRHLKKAYSGTGSLVVQEHST